MSGGGWAALDRLLETLRTAPARTGSVISTVYGDAVLPRGGALALADLLTLMGRLGASEGVVRTAISRLGRDGVLVGRRTGRHSAYGLTEGGEAAFRAAVPAIYGAAAVAWDGRLRLAFPDDAGARAALERSGFQAFAAGVMVGLGEAPEGVLAVEACQGEGRRGGTALPEIARRAWPVAALDGMYAGFLEAFAALDPPSRVAPLDAMAARVTLIHAWRRIALRDPRLPAALLPGSWHGGVARARCVALYGALAAASEVWLDGAMAAGSAPLPPGPAPQLRWGGAGSGAGGEAASSGGGRLPGGKASSPGPARGRRQRRSGPP